MASTRRWPAARPGARGVNPLRARSAWSSIATYTCFMMGKDSAGRPAWPAPPAPPRPARRTRGRGADPRRRTRCSGGPPAAAYFAGRANQRSFGTAWAPSPRPGARTPRRRWTGCVHSAFISLDALRNRATYRSRGSTPKAANGYRGRRCPRADLDPALAELVQRAQALARRTGLYRRTRIPCSPAAAVACRRPRRVIVPIGLLVPRPSKRCSWVHALSKSSPARRGRPGTAADRTRRRSKLRDGDREPHERQRIAGPDGYNGSVDNPTADLAERMRAICSASARPGRSLDR